MFNGSNWKHSSEMGSYTLQDLRDDNNRLSAYLREKADQASNISLSDIADKTKEVASKASTLTISDVLGRTKKPVINTPVKTPVKTAVAPKPVLKAPSKIVITAPQANKPMANAPVVPQENSDANKKYYYTVGALTVLGLGYLLYTKRM